MLRCKVALVGDAGVGKSSLAQMFRSGGSEYPKNYLMTIGVEFSTKQVPITNTNTSVELYIFDCAGQSIFNQRQMNAKNYENSSYVMVVYDVSSRESFQSCGKWLQSVRAARPSSSGQIPGILVANKVDLRQAGRAGVTREEGEEYAKTNGLKYFECSAKTPMDVDGPFTYIANQFHIRYEEAIRKAEHMNSRRDF